MSQLDSQRLERAKELISTFVGEYIWLVRSDEFGVLTFNFGEPFLRVRQPSSPEQGRSHIVRDAVERRSVIPTGRGRFFVYNGNWSIKTLNYQCSRYGNGKDCPAAIRQLDGQALSKVDFLCDVGELVLQFDLGGELRIILSSDMKDTKIDGSCWVLFLENGSSITFTSSGAWEFGAPAPKSTSN